jgi:hypothetical protein
MSAWDLYSLPLVFYPWFDLAHFICCARIVRKDAEPEFARKQPLASCVATLVACYAGGILTNLFLGKPVLAAFERQDKILLAVTVWACVNFSPRDSFHRLCSSPLNLHISFALKEIYRMHKVVKGIDLASEQFPANLVIQAVTGIVRGSGTNFFRPVTKMICETGSGGVFSELARPSLGTQASGVCAVVWLLAKTSAVVPIEQIYAAVTVGLVVHRFTVTANEFRTDNQREGYNEEDNDNERDTTVGGTEKEAEEFSSQLKDDNGNEKNGELLLGKKIQ